VGRARLRRIAGGRDGALLLSARVVMSAQRALVGVVVPIYLARRGFSATELGALFALVALAAAGMSTLIGVLADRVARKPFIVAMPLLSAGAGLVFGFTDATWALFAAAALGSYGRGAGAGAAQIGPYQPAEQAMMAGLVEDRARNALFALIASASAAGGLLGTILTLTPLTTPTTGHVVLAATYRPAFIASALLAALAAALALPVRERRGAPVARAAREPGDAEEIGAPGLPGDEAVLGDAEEAADTRLGAGVAPIRLPGDRNPAGGGANGGARSPGRLSPQSRRLIRRLWATNGVNGLAVGLFGPFITYWLYRRFGAGPAEVGAVYTAANVVTIATNQLASPLARRRGTVRTVVIARTLQALMLPLLALAPTIVIAGAIYTLRLVAQRIGLSLRQSFIMSAAPPSERARVAAFSQLPVQGISALAPTLSGYLFDEVSLAAPFELAGALQLANAWLFHHYFGAADEQRQPR
jgi:MFS family permease